MAALLKLEVYQRTKNYEHLEFPMFRVMLLREANFGCSM